MIDRIISEIDILLQNSAKSNKVLSTRFNPFWAYKRADNNIFALASTLFILSENQKYFNESQNQTLERIQAFFKNQVTFYQNRDGRNTYNFYPTKPSKHFANGYVMQYFDHFRLPDDIDDTAVIYFANKKNKEEVEWLRNHAENHSDNNYNTWFGKNMPKELDVCALLNLQYLFFYHDLKKNAMDKATLIFLAESIDKIETDTFWISRHYANIPLIVYHYARFMYCFKVEELEKQKPKLIDICLRKLETEKVFLNQILLKTTLLKLGFEAKNETGKTIFIPVDFEEMIDNFQDYSKGFYSFIGAPFAPLQRFKSLASSPLTQIFWKSEILEWAILLEYIVISQNLLNFDQYIKK